MKLLRLRKIQTVPKYVWILLLIFCVGFAFRTYEFHDFLRFNADQSRDAGIVSSIIDGEGDIPLLGPKAGGTTFRVGPAFYYFQIISAKVFGNAPDKMAYPDLFFSLLTIVLLFFFLRQYFDMKKSLLLIALLAVSFYAVKYGRFAWNPNSLPFWTLLFLFGLYKMMTARETAWKWWTFVTGLALGIGIQLHSLSLILFPLLAFCVFGFLIYQKREYLWKKTLLILALILFLNIPVLISEWQTGGVNAKAFIESIGMKEKKGSGFVANIEKNIVCFSQSSTYILSGYDSSDTCERKSVMHGLNIQAFLCGFILFFGGLLLAIRALRKEKRYERRVFLGLMILFVSILFFLLVPLANEISMRFFLISLFIPFVFLGLWFDFFEEIFPRTNIIFLFGITIVLVCMNIFFVLASFKEYHSYLTNSSAGMDNVLLKEVEDSASFIVSESRGAKKVVLTGDKKYIFKAMKSMEYFTKRSGIQIIEKNKKTDPSLPVFLVENTKNKEKVLASEKNIAQYLSFGRFTLFSLKL